MATTDRAVHSLLCYTVIAVGCHTCARIFWSPFRSPNAVRRPRYTCAQPNEPISTARGEGQVRGYIISGTKKWIYARFELLPVRLF